MPAAVEKVGPYVVERELGRGAFGVVYRAAHPDDPGTPVALKVVEARGRLDRVMAEPALLAKLDHPCVVRVLDYFRHGDDQLAIALELVGGGDLKAEIDAAGRLPPEAVRDLLVQIGGALAEAHAKGVVHRDLKPANILLDRTGPRTRYVLTDFGVGREGTGIRSEKQVAGTYLFMAPEQLRGRPGPQSDLWALGVVAYRMLTGAYPFPGPTVADLARQIQLTTPAPPSTATGAALDPALERVVLRLLDRSETERIGSAAELLAALGHTGDSRRVLAGRPQRPQGRVAARQQSLDETLARGVRRNRRQAVGWLAALFVTGSPLSGPVAVASMVLFYRAFDRHAGAARRWRIGAAILLACLIVPLTTTEAVGRQLVVTRVAGLLAALHWTLVAVWGLASAAVGLVGPILFPALAAGAYARANKLRREQVLLRAAAAGAGADEYLTLLRDELEYRYEDVGFHLKYAEALAARGDDRAAAIEARLLLVQDPYHFAGNLLLAQSYLRLGLAHECEQVCSDYLAVAGYCFEFQELRDQARRQRGTAA